MIKCDKFTVEICGEKSEILSQFTCIIRSLRENNISDEEINKALELSKLSTEEMQDRVNKSIKEFLEKIINKLDEK